MLSTRRRRRAVVLGLAPLTSPVWAAGAAPSFVAGLPVERVSRELLAAIVAERPDGYPIGGIDISSHDHERFPVQWPVEVAAGSQFAYVKATEGTTYINPHFVSDYTAARTAHRYVGAYVYARPDKGDPIGQADHFLRHARFTRDSQTLVPFVDLEWPNKGSGRGPEPGWYRPVNAAPISGVFVHQVAQIIRFQKRPRHGRLP